MSYPTLDPHEEAGYDEEADNDEIVTAPFGGPSMPYSERESQISGICRYCERRIVHYPNGLWGDPEATGDDDIWRFTCDRHDTFTAEHEPVTNIATDGVCGLSWDDSIITSLTPAPAARCPFEAFHMYTDDDEALLLFTKDIPADFPVVPIGREYQARHTVDFLLGALGETEQERDARHLAERGQGDTMKVESETWVEEHTTYRFSDLDIPVEVQTFHGTRGWDTKKRVIREAFVRIIGYSDGTPSTATMTASVQNVKKDGSLGAVSRDRYPTGEIRDAVMALVESQTSGTGTEGESNA